MSPPKPSINTEHQYTEGEVSPKTLVGKTTASTHNSSPPSHGKNQEIIDKIENLAQQMRRLSSDVKPSGKLPFTDERLNTAKDSLEQPHKVTREEIRIQQHKEVKDLQVNLDNLLKQHLPSFVFAADSNIPRPGKNTKNDAGIPPTILVQQVRRAQTSAELDVYLAYLTDPQKKSAFLQQWTTMQKNANRESTEMMKTFTLRHFHDQPESKQEWRLTTKAMKLSTGEIDVRHVKDMPIKAVNKLSPMLKKGIVPFKDDLFADRPRNDSGYVGMNTPPRVRPRG